MTDVYFLRLKDNNTLAETQEALKLFINKLDLFDLFETGDFVAIKQHFGEAGNNAYIKAPITSIFVQKLKSLGSKPFLTETSVLYRSKRSNSVDHISLAYEHGFNCQNVGAPIVMLDGVLGNYEVEVLVDGEIDKQVKVAGDLKNIHGLLVLSHPTGHIISGLGGALKNLGMGLSSRKGKLRQHVATKPFVNQQKCTLCKDCLDHCPNNALEERTGHMKIINKRCIGCGECLTICKFEAISFHWDMASEVLQKKMVEHAKGVINLLAPKIVYFNFLIDMTDNCDCMGGTNKIIDDLGVLASTDPLAIDWATLELCAQNNNGKNLAELAHPNINFNVQLDYAQKLGLGSKKYNLIEI